VIRILLLLFFLFSFLQSSIAQDTLFRLSGESIGVKVLEITPLEIKYKLTSNLEGPTYTVLKSDVFMIEYANGSNDVFGVKSPTPKENAAKSDSLLLKEERNLRGYVGGGTTGVVLGSVGLAVSVPFLIISLINIKSTGNAPIIGSVFGTLMSVTALAAGISSLKKASAIRMRLAKNSTASLNLSPELLNTTAFSGPIINRGNGIGVRLSLTF
jgi:hypothetical protein